MHAHSGSGLIVGVGILATLILAAVILTILALIGVIAVISRNTGRHKRLQGVYVNIHALLMTPC